MKPNRRVVLPFRFITVSVVTTTCLCALILVCALSIYYSRMAYRDAVTSAKENVSRLARVVSANVEISFVSVNQTLQRAAERQYFNMLFGKTLSRDMEHNISLWVNETPHIQALMITDEYGVVDLLFQKGKEDVQVSPGFTFSVKEHFERHKQDASADMLISPSRQSNSSLMYASRRIENIDGSFGGLVLAVIEGKYISEFLQSIEQESTAQVALLLDDGNYLVGDPNKEATFRAVSGNFDRSNAGVTMTDTVINDERMIFSHEHLKNAPLSVMLAVDEDSIFKLWRKERNEYILFVSIFAVFVAMVLAFSHMLGRQIKQTRKSEKKALLASQTKSDFLAKMSHELRTPLNAIIGFSDMLASGYFGKVTTDQVERLNDINMCGNHLLDLINDILDFSKADAGKLTLKEEVVDLYAISTKAIRILEQKAKIGQVRVVNAIPRDMNALYADARKLKQILLNLLSNSVKFTPEGGKVILSCHWDKEHNLVITVSDTGRGIDPKDIPKAMGLFEQVHGDAADQGTGLGLPLCQMFAEMHGGSFRLESKVGVGTTAYVSIPHKRIRNHTVIEEAMATVG